MCLTFFDIRYDRKAEKNTGAFTKFDYCNIFWLKITNFNHRENFRRLKVTKLRLSDESYNR